MSNLIDLATEDNLQYTFYPVQSGYFAFKVRAPNDAHIALTTAPQESDPMVEVFIGGWGNTKSVIRRNRTKPEMAEVDTPGILNAGEFRGFWVRWDGGIIAAGREGEVVPFLTWQDPAPFPIGFVGVCTGWGATGTWKIEVSSSPSAPYTQPTQMPMGGGGGSCVWVPSSGGQLPPGAVAGGQDGETLYVARARHEGALLPGKLVPGHGKAYVAWGGAEHAKDEYEVLVGGNCNWVASSGANIPPGAFPAGETEEGEPLFVGRAQHEGSLTIGKVQPSHGVCYIPYGGQELGFPDYEILVV